MAKNVDKSSFIGITMQYFIMVFIGIFRGQLREGSCIDDFQAQVVQIKLSPTFYTEFNKMATKCLRIKAQTALLI